MPSKEIEDAIDRFANNPNIDIRGKRYCHKYNRANSTDYEEMWKTVLRELEEQKAIECFTL